MKQVFRYEYCTEMGTTEEKEIDYESVPEEFVDTAEFAHSDAIVLGIDLSEE